MMEMLFVSSQNYSTPESDGSAEESEGQVVQVQMSNHEGLKMYEDEVKIAW